MKKINRYNVGVMALVGFLLLSCGSGNKTQNNSGDATSVSTYETVVTNANIPSPRKVMKGMLGGTSLQVEYGSPSVKDRKVWDGLVPYGSVWRTGANEATTIEISKEVEVEGKKLVAGKYGLFTIPNANEWVVIFNSVHKQWGSSNYDQSKDVLRVNVTPKAESNAAETLEFVMENNALVMKWDNLSVPVQIKN